MRIRPKSSISAPEGPGASARTRAAEPAERRRVPEGTGLVSDGDAVEISVTSEALNRTGDVHSLTAAVGAGAYEASSEATSHALVEDALLKGDLTYD